MAKGASSSQAGQGSSRAGAVARSSPAGGVQRRRGVQYRAAGSKQTSAPGGSGLGAGLIRFHEDTTGLEVGPVAVMILSVSLIGFVILLHIWGRISG